MNIKRKNLKMICFMLAMMLMSMTFMSIPAIAVDTEGEILEINESYLCGDCDHDHGTLAGAEIAEGVDPFAIGCTSPLGHRWVWDYEIREETRGPNINFCRLVEVMRRDFERCTRCGITTGSTFYFVEARITYHTWSGNRCTGCGFTR